MKWQTVRQRSHSCADPRIIVEERERGGGGVGEDFCPSGLMSLRAFGLHSIMSGLILVQTVYNRKINILRNIFQTNHQSVKQFGSRSSPHYVRPYLGPKSKKRMQGSRIDTIKHQS